MNFIQTSGDVLNLVIAAAVALFVLFVCWGLFYAVLAFRNIYKITKDTRKSFKKVEEVLGEIKEQVQAGTFYISLAKEGISKGVEFLREKTGSSGNKRKSNSTNNNKSKKNSTTSTGKKGTTKNSSASGSKKTTSSSTKNNKSKKS